MLVEVHVRRMHNVEEHAHTDTIRHGRVRVGDRPRVCDQVLRSTSYPNCSARSATPRTSPSATSADGARPLAGRVFALLGRRSIAASIAARSTTPPTALTNVAVCCASRSSSRYGRYTRSSRRGPSRQAVPFHPVPRRARPFIGRGKDLGAVSAQEAHEVRTPTARTSAPVTRHEPRPELAEAARSSRPASGSASRGWSWCRRRRRSGSRGATKQQRPDGALGAARPSPVGVRPGTALRARTNLLRAPGTRRSARCTARTALRACRGRRASTTASRCTRYPIGRSP